MWGYPEFMILWIVGIICMVVFWAIFVGLVVWGIKQFSGNRGAVSPKEATPIEIAQMRLARGEISREQFEEIRETLR